MSFAPGISAARAWLREWVVIIEFGGHPFAAVDDVQRLVAHKRTGQVVTLKMVRRSEKMVIDIVPGKKVELEHIGGRPW